jgi:uncharacterized protein
MQCFEREGWWGRFQELLDAQNDWPSEYLFKFIAPSSGLGKLKAIFGRYPVKVRQSAQGNYVSVTALMEIHSSEEVIEIYRTAADVEGVISL